ncbi:MAG: hypothetical protein AB8H47_17970 [Bacteroidia bacterium]
MENQNDIRGLLEEKFQHHEATPSRDIWAQIEADINPSQKKKVVWWPYMAVAASALILFGLWALLPSGNTSNLPSGNGMAETTPTENAAPNTQESVRPAIENKNLSAQDEVVVEEDDSPAKIQPLYQQTSSKNFAQEEVVPEPETPQEEVQQETIKSYAIALNPISPINPQLYPDAPVHQLEQGTAEVVKPTKLTESIADNSSKLKPVKDNKLDLNEFSLENVVAFASNELSKIAGSPLEYERQEGENTERKRYEIELGDFKFTRTSFRKTTKQ